MPCPSSDIPTAEQEARQLYKTGEAVLARLEKAECERDEWRESEEYEWNRANRLEHRVQDLEAAARELLSAISYDAQNPSGFFHRETEVIRLRNLLRRGAA